jgi:hypothetical protein
MQFARSSGQGSANGSQGEDCPSGSSLETYASNSPGDSSLSGCAHEAFDSAGRKQAHLDASGPAAGQDPAGGLPAPGAFCGVAAPPARGVMHPRIGLLPGLPTMYMGSSPLMQSGLMGQGGPSGHPAPPFNGVGVGAQRFPENFPQLCPETFHEYVRQVAPAAPA